MTGNMSKLVNSIERQVSDRHSLKQFPTRLFDQYGRNNIQTNIQKKKSLCSFLKNISFEILGNLQNDFFLVNHPHPFLSQYFQPLYTRMPSEINLRSVGGMLKPLFSLSVFEFPSRVSFSQNTQLSVSFDASDLRESQVDKILTLFLEIFQFNPCAEL